jgi:hypothetical protein
VRWQVNLCEWRKMLAHVDTSRCMKRGVTVAEVLRAVSAGGERGRAAPLVVPLPQSPALAHEAAC